MKKRKILETIKEESRFHESEDPVDKIIFDLKRSGRPTLVVEGVDDEAIYKRVRREIFQELESYVNAGDSKFPDLPNVHVEIAGNKDIVLEIYNKRSEFEKLVPVAFMVDQDKWVYSKIPARYSRAIICTTGYSIENDLYSDGEPKKLIPSTKVAQYACELANAIGVWAREVAISEAKGCNSKANTLEKKYKKEINDNPELKLRGKTLFNLLLSVCGGARNHLELCMQVFSTINWDKEPPKLLSTLVWNIQSDIENKRTAIPHRTFISAPSKKRP